MKKRFTVGCDPEFFLRRKGTGEFVSSVGLIPGTKKRPFKIEGGAGLQKDNVAVEFSSPVGKSGDDFVEKLRVVFRSINKYIPEGLELVAIPSAVFPDSELQTEEAKEFGCDPDYNAWTLSVNEVPSHPNPNFRSCGGHVHVGHVKGDGNDFLLDPFGKIEAVKAMDAIHGIVSITLDNSHASAERRILYGKAGCHRPTKYGVEYRVLSNFWLKSPKTVLLVDSLTSDMLDAVRSSKHDDLITSITADGIQDIINNNRVKEAEAAVKDVLSKGYLSEASKSLYNECYAHIGEYDPVAEWA